MRSLVIVGSSSRLYQEIKPWIEVEYDLLEHSHKDFEQAPKECPVLVFALAKDLSENLRFLELLSSHFTGLKVYIGSTSVLAHHTRYSYPRLKACIESAVLSKEQWKVLRVGMPKSGERPVLLRTRRLITDERSFCGALKFALTDDENLVNAYHEKRGNAEFFARGLSWLYRAMYSNKILSFIAKPFDLFLKTLHICDYGYTFISNHTNSEALHVRKILVGGGITAENLLARNDTIDLVMRPTRSHLEQDSTLERIGYGGNSDFWHGVISLLSNRHYSKKELLRAERVFNKSYAVPGSDALTLLNSGYSYIPWRPHRPEVDEEQCLDSEVLRIVKTDTGFCLVTLERLLFCQVCEVAAGALNSIRLLQRSQLVNDTIRLDEHMVGYFGQVTLSQAQLPDVIFRGRGHFKKFLRIPIDEARVMYVNLRPALADFRDIKQASKARAVFGTKTSNVIARIIKGFSLGLVLEAIYNKFGLTLKSNLFNIVGHVEMKEFVEIDNGRVLYKSTKMTFSPQDKRRVITEIRNSHPSAQSVELQTEIELSPGLHFQNGVGLAQLARVPYLNLHGTSTLPSSPEHPTFTLMIQD